MQTHVYLTAAFVTLTITVTVGSPSPGSSVQHESTSPITTHGSRVSSVQTDGSTDTNVRSNDDDRADAPASTQKVHSVDIGVVIVPGIQGTLLYRCAGLDKSSKCSPIFLSPLTTDIVDRAYKYISDVKTGKTTALTHESGSADYPAITCAPQPYSHIGHCNRLPAHGPIRALRDYITSSFPSATIDSIPYDWRMSTYELTSSRSASSIVPTFAKVIDSIAQPKRVIIVGHGHGCRVIAHLLNGTSDEITLRKARIHAFVCAAPSHPDQAVRALVEGSGILLTEAAHADGDACTNVREKRADFSVVQPLMGLTRRRLKNLPTANGAWDASENWQLVSSIQQRARLASSLPSFKELAASNGGVPSVYDIRNVFCINAQTSENYSPACHMIAHSNQHASLHQSGESDMHISALVGDILGSLVQQ